MIQSPRGTRDFLPDELEKRRFYENRLRHTARTFGFREVETPIFEDAELFILRSGPNVLKELYAFEDKGGRQIALRPEMTAPVVRMFVNNMSNEPKPIKVFYFGQCFRYERPQSGRYREFFQFGAEIIGSATPETDAEAIALAYAMIGQIGVKNYRIRIGHIGVLRQRIADAGVPAERTAEVLQKLDKKLYDEARPLMEDMGVKVEDIDDIFSLTETVGGVEVLDRVPGEAGDWLRQVVAYLKVMGVEDLEIDLGVVRGLDYYTGMVFEAEAPALGAEKQICGGGSYTLSELFGGEKVFSTGFAIGFDRILLALEKEGSSYDPEGLRGAGHRGHEGQSRRGHSHAEGLRRLRRHRHHGQEDGQGAEVRVVGQGKVRRHRGREGDGAGLRHPQGHVHGGADPCEGGGALREDQRLSRSCIGDGPNHY